MGRPRPPWLETSNTKRPHDSLGRAPPGPGQPPTQRPRSVPIIQFPESTKSMTKRRPVKRFSLNQCLPFRMTRAFR